MFDLDSLSETNVFWCCHVLVRAMLYMLGAAAGSFQKVKCA